MTIPCIYLAQTEEIGNVPVHEVYSMSSSTRLVIAKGVITTKHMAYCRNKLRDCYCDGIINSIIFRISE